MRFYSYTKAQRATSVNQTKLKSLGLIMLFAMFGIHLLNAQSTIYSTNFGTSNVVGITSPGGTLQTGWASSGAQSINLALSTSSASTAYTSPANASGSANLADGNAGTVTGTSVMTVSGLVNTTGYTGIQVLYAARKTAAYSGTITFEWSPDGTTWTPITFTEVPATSTWTAINGGTWMSLPVGAENVSNLRFRWTFVRSNTSGNYRIDDFYVRGTPSTPTINVTASLGGFYTTTGTPSTSRSYTVSGNNLTTDIVITPPTGYEIKKSTDPTYSSTVNLAPSGGTVASTTIDVRLTGASAGFFDNNITHTSTSATTQNAAVKGIVQGTTASFTTGNIAVVQAGVGDNLTNGTSVPILIREYTNTGTPVQVIGLPTADSGGNQSITMSNSGTSEGSLSLSDDGQRLTVAGYDAAPGTANVASTTSVANNRIVASIDKTGTINSSTRISDAYSANNIRSGVANSDIGFWVSGAGSGGGVRFVANGSTGTSTSVAAAPNNTRVVTVQGGQLYTSSTTAPNIGLNTIGTGTPTTTGQTTTLISSISAADAYGYVFLDRSGVVSGFDVVYIANNTGLLKFSFNGTTWTARGTLSGTNVTGICGAVNGASADLYISTGDALYKLTDAAAFNSNITGDGTAISASATLIASPLPNTAFRGVAFAPTAAPQCTYYLDNDGDGYGQTASTTLASCSSTPVGYASVGGDCNDTPVTGVSIYPGAVENACNSIDDNCDTAIDENFVAGCNNNTACNYNPLATCAIGCDFTPQTWYLDGDSDGYGGTTSVVSCTSPGVTYILTNGDCNDALNTINPGVAEVLCNLNDDDCDGTVDEGSVFGCTNSNASNYNSGANCDDGSCIVPTSFGAGNIVVSRVGDGSGALSSAGTPIYLDQITPAGTLVNSFAIPTTGSSRLVLSGSSTSEGQITLNPDKTSVIVAGYDTLVGTTSVSSAGLVKRAIGQVLSNYTYNRPSTNISFNTGNNFRSACRNGNNYWGVGGAGGVNYFGTGTPSGVSTTVTNIRAVSTFNNELYFSTGSGTTRGIYKVGSGMPTTTGQTATTYINMGASASPYAFQFNEAGNICYIADDRLGAAGGILKYQNTGSWVLAAQFNLGTNNGATGVYVDFYSEATPIVYVVIKDNTSATSLVRFNDTGISGAQTPTLTTLRTPSTNTAIRAVQAAPCVPTTWYADADGDGYGNNSITLSTCAQPYGYVADNTDCDDTNNLIHPNGEICFTGVSEDCDGEVDEGCVSPLGQDTPAGAQLVTYSNNIAYPNCYPINGSLLNTLNSSESTTFNGNDVWYRFTAQSTAVSITMSSASFDDAIEVYTKTGTVYNLVPGGTENAASGASDFERLNLSGLTPGTVYYVSVGAASGYATGTFTLCIQHLMPSGCSYQTPVGGFSLCSSYKAIYRGAPGNGVTYTFNFNGVGGGASGLTSLSGTNGLIALSNPTLALRYGGVYNVSVDVQYALQDALGAPEVISVAGSVASANCSGVTIMNQPLLEVKTNQRCPASLLRANYLIGTPVSGNGNACTAINYTFEFTQVLSCGDNTVQGVPTPFTTGSATPYLPLGNLPNLSNVGAWSVRIRPNFSYGVGLYGPAQLIQVSNTASSALAPDQEITDESARMFELGITSAVYPNPNSGDIINVNVTDIQSNMIDLKVIDAIGKIVYQKNYSVDGNLQTVIQFENELNSGIYFIEFTDGTKVWSEKMIVQK